jgi:hypothetical protein
MEEENMMKQILFVLAALALLSSAACAQTPASPTVDPGQIQASAVAAANTMVALTQAAIPTDTQMPPTPLSSPTDQSTPTPFALPTLDNSFPTASAPTLAPASGGTSVANCNQPLALKTGGPKTPLHIINSTKGTANIGLYLSLNAFGDCGFVRTSPIAKNGSADYTLPAGCYYPTAYVNDPNHQSTAQGPTFCIKGPLKWTIFVEPDNFKISPP